MILVDYKGGAAFAPVRGAAARRRAHRQPRRRPALTERARASIDGEVVRRQQLLKDAGSSPSITHYRELRREHPDLRAAAAPVPRHRRVRRAAHGRARLRRPAPHDRAHRPVDRRAPAAVEPAHRGRQAARPRHVPVVPDRSAHVLRGGEHRGARHPRRVPPAGRARASATSRSTPASTRGSAPATSPARCERPSEPPEPEDDLRRPLLLRHVQRRPRRQRHRTRSGSAARSEPVIGRPSVSPPMVDVIVRQLSRPRRRPRARCGCPAAARLTLGRVLGRTEPPASEELSTIAQEGRTLSVPDGAARRPGAPAPGRRGCSTSPARAGTSRSSAPRSPAAPRCCGRCRGLALTHTPRRWRSTAWTSPAAGSPASRGSRTSAASRPAPAGTGCGACSRSCTACSPMRERVFARRGIDSLAMLRARARRRARARAAAADVVLLVDGVGRLRPGLRGARGQLRRPARARWRLRHPRRRGDDPLERAAAQRCRPSSAPASSCGSTTRPTRRSAASSPRPSAGPGGPGADGREPLRRRSPCRSSTPPTRSRPTRSTPPTTPTRRARAPETPSAQPSTSGRPVGRAVARTRGRAHPPAARAPRRSTRCPTRSTSPRAALRPAPGHHGARAARPRRARPAPAGPRRHAVGQDDAAAHPRHRPRRAQRPRRPRGRALRRAQLDRRHLPRGVPRRARVEPDAGPGSVGLDRLGAREALGRARCRGTRRRHRGAAHRRGGRRLRHPRLRRHRPAPPAAALPARGPRPAAAPAASPALSPGRPARSTSRCSRPCGTPAAPGSSCRATAPRASCSPACVPRRSRRAVAAGCDAASAPCSSRWPSTSPRSTSRPARR